MEQYFNHAKKYKNSPFNEFIFISNSETKIKDWFLILKKKQ